MNDAKQNTDRKPVSGHLHMANFNPWGKKMDDCAIKACSAAFMMKYVEVCRRLGYEVWDGVGLDRLNGSDAYDVFNAFKDFLEGGTARSFKPGRTVTLDQFCDGMAEASPGLYLVWTKGPKYGVGHLVYVCAKKPNPYFIDDFDSGGHLVQAWGKVARQCGKDDPARISQADFVRA